MPDSGLRNKSRFFQRTPDPGPLKTHVTYDETLVIRCMDSSPFIFCNGRPLPRSDVEKKMDQARHKPWKFAMVRPFSWRLEWNFSSCPYNNCVDDSNHVTSETDILGFNGQGLEENEPLVGRSNQSRMFILWESPGNTGSTFQLGKLPWLALLLLLFFCACVFFFLFFFL